VKFHATEWFKPSREFNADDVVWSMQRLIDRNNAWHKQAANGFPYSEGMEFPALIKSVEKLDPYSVKITLNHPESPFLADLAMGFASIFSAEYAAQLEKAGRQVELNTRPIGTGPFVFKSYQKDAQVRYTANPVYWRGKAKFDNLVFAITLDANVRVQRLKAGECQIALYPKVDLLDDLKKDPNLVVSGKSVLTLAYIFPNTAKPPFTDKRFRQALWYGLDKANFIKVYFNGNATAAAASLPPGMWGYDKSLKDRTFDVEKARQLVKASGYDGREIVLWARVGGIYDSKRAAEMMQADWTKIGVNVKVQPMEWGELLKRAGSGEHDISFMMWSSDNGDPDNFLTPNLSCAAAESGGNRSKWCDKKFDGLLHQAKIASNSAARTSLYMEAQKISYKEAPWIPIAYPTFYVAHRKNVHGFIQSPFSTNNFYSVTLQ
jgi:dipeptide transport system substrate-binding protein